MDKGNKTQEHNEKTAATTGTNNPFENSQPVEKDLEQSAEELEKEQQFKEAQTERD